MSYIIDAYKFGASAPAFGVTSITDTAIITAETVHTINMPPATVSGDLLIAFCAYHTPLSGTKHADWTELFWSTTTNTGLLCYTKAATGAEGGTQINIITTTVGKLMLVSVLRISATTREVSCQASPATVGLSTLPNPPSITPSWGSAGTLWIPVMSASNDGADVTAYPSGYTNGHKQRHIDATLGLTLAFDYRIATAATEDPGTFTLGVSEYWCANTVGVRPSA